MVRTPQSEPVLGPEGTWRAAHVWNPQSGGGKEFTVVLGPGDPSVILPVGSGGSFWRILDPNCHDAGMKLWETAKSASHTDINLGTWIDMYVPSAPSGGPATVYSPPASAPRSNPPAAQQPASPPPAPQCNSWSGGQDPVLGSPWTIAPGSAWAVANVWTNAAPGSPLWKVLIAPGSSVAIASGGGDVTFWPANCGDVAKGNYAANGNSVYSEAALAAFINANSAPPPPAAPPPAPEPVCGQSSSYSADVGDLKITGPAIANIWSNATADDQGEYKTLIPHGVSVTFKKMGGTIWPFDVGCSPQHLQDNYNANGLPGRTIDQWRALGLVY